MKLSFRLWLEVNVPNKLNTPECMFKELLGFVYINIASVESVMSVETMCQTCLSLIAGESCSSHSSAHFPSG